MESQRMISAVSEELAKEKVNLNKLRLRLGPLYDQAMIRAKELLAEDERTRRVPEGETGR
jgi:hypothetical protein